MIARIVILMLIAVLALPVATLTQPVETGPSPWGEAAVAAKGKKHKNKKSKQPASKSVTRTERQMVTQTFSSTESITIPAGAPTSTDSRPANPYPSAIEVRGFRNGTITDVNLILEDFTHTLPPDVDILLSSGDGRHALVMSDVGSPINPIDADLTLDDEGAVSLPGPEAGVNLTSGTYRPANHTYFADLFAAPAPNPDGTVALSTFDGADPNGTWRLWVMDNNGSDVGDIAGWTLEITAEVDVTVEEQVPAPPAKAKKHKKKGKGRR